MKAFFQKIVSFLHILFGVNLDAWIESHVQPSIEFVQRFKAIVDNPVTDLIAALIPGGTAEKVRELLSDNLAKAINILHLSADIAAEPDWTRKILKATDLLRNSSDSFRSAVYAKLATELSKLSAGATANTIKNHSIDLLVQTQYSKLKEGLEASDLPDAPEEPSTPEPLIGAAQQGLAVQSAPAAAPVVPTAETAPAEAAAAPVATTVEKAQ